MGQRRILKVLLYHYIFMKDRKESMLAIKVLANPHRFAIVELLLHRKNEDLCVNQIAEATGISQPLASQHLAFLQAHGVIEGHRMGQTICYHPSPSPITKKVTRIIRALSLAERP